MFKEIWGAARRNKLRTALTGFSVAWGIFMIIFLLGSGNGLINAQLQQQDNYLTNSMLVGGGYTSKPYHGLKENRAITLDDRDVEMTDTLFAHNVKRVGGVAYAYGVTVRYANNYVADQTLVGEGNKQTKDYLRTVYQRYRHKRETKGGGAHRQTGCRTGERLS